MTGNRISDMTVKTGLLLGDVIPVVSGGQNYKMAVSGLFAVTPQMFGAKADGTTDDTAAFQAALDYLEGLAGTGGSPMLFVPFGKYRISNVNIKHKVKILGEGGGQAGATNSQIFLPAAGDGFIVNRYNTLGDATVTPRAYGADGTIIEGIDFVGPGSGAANANNAAIKARARVEIDRCTFSGIAGHGIMIRATQGAGGSQEGNANCWVIGTIRVQNCAYDGVFVTGSDVNAGTCKGKVDCSENGRWGINDLAFLSNRWDFHVESNGVAGCNGFTPLTKSSVCIHSGRSYVIVPGQEASGLATTPGTNASIWRDIGTAVAWPEWSTLTAITQGGAAQIGGSNSLSTADGYSEPGQGPLWLGPNTVLNGGNYCGNIGGSYQRSNGLAGGGLSSSDGFLTQRVKADGVTNLMRLIGCDPVNNEYDAFIAPGGNRFGFANFANDLGVLVDALFETFRIKSGSTAETFGRATNTTTRGVLQLQKGVWLGSGSNARQLTFVHASDLASALTALAGAEVALGDTFLFDQPAAGGKRGAVVVTAGTVGTTAVLKAFGTIDA